MKKYLSIFFVALIATFSAGLFLSCSSDDDDDEFGRYEAYSDNAFGHSTCQAMEQAIAVAFGNDVAYKRNDSKAIKICDEIANKVRDQNLIKSITLKFSRSHTGTESEGERVVVKTYTFPF